MSHTTLLIQKIHSQLQDLSEAQLRELTRYLRFLRYNAKARRTQLQLSEEMDASQLSQARALMRALGHGLGAGQPPHDVARNHDRYLYARDR
jgi:hypothetical protein